MLRPIVPTSPLSLLSRLSVYRSRTTVRARRGQSTCLLDDKMRLAWLVLLCAEAAIAAARTRPARGVYAASTAHSAAMGPATSLFLVPLHNGHIGRPRLSELGGLNSLDGSSESNGSTLSRRVSGSLLLQVAQGRERPGGAAGAFFSCLASFVGWLVGSFLFSPQSLSSTTLFSFSLSLPLFPGGDLDCRPFRAAENATKWVVFIKGGGWCTSIADCYERSFSTLGSSRSYAPTLDLSSKGGLVSDDPSVRAIYNSCAGTPSHLD